jgi:Cu2+-exporting ATPase
MKKTVLNYSLAVIFGLSILSSCSSNQSKQDIKHHKEKEHVHSEDETETSFYCPMKCEGEKVYVNAGSCPKCGMDLIEK